MLDTTTLNCTALKDCASSSRRLFVQASMACSEGRRPLGLSGLEVWARLLEEPRDEEGKESERWFRGLDQGLCLARTSRWWSTAKATSAT